MKVILLQDVAKIGRRFQIVNVPDGYALNKLVPMRLAEPATPVNVKRIEAMAKKHATNEADTLSAFAALCATLADKKITVKAEANAEGKLFQALKPQAIAVAMSEQTGQTVPVTWIHTALPVKTVGEHTVLLSCGNKQGECTLEVIST
jgi:large subunit ribosomal protein L9